MDRLIAVNDESSKAFNELFNRLGSLDLTPILIYLVDEVEPSALSRLAEQFHILGNEGWLFAEGNVQTQRRLIKNAIQIHKYKGTKYSLEKVLESLNLNGKVIEWFNYSDNPFYFKVNLDLEHKSFDKTTELRLFELIQETKNVRSVMEKLEVNLVNTATQSIRSTVISSEEITLGMK